MSNDNEQTASEFHYPSKQSDAEQLQFPGNESQHSSQMRKLKIKVNKIGI